MVSSMKYVNAGSPSMPPAHPLPAGHDALNNAGTRRQVTAAFRTRPMALLGQARSDSPGWRWLYRTAIAKSGARRGQRLLRCAPGAVPTGVRIIASHRSELPPGLRERHRAPRATGAALL